MLPDPITLYHTPPTGATFNVAVSGAGGGNYSFVCTGRGPLQSTYRKTNSATNWVELVVGRQNNSKNRIRYTARLTENEIVADAMDPSINSLKSATVYVVADVGPLGSTTNFPKLVHMLACLLYDSTDAAPVFDRVVAGET